MTVEMQISPTLRARFEASIDRTTDARGCFCWVGKSKTPGGYGQISIASGISKGAHVVAWYLETGEWPVAILHECDNRLCVNTRHMRNGTKGENNKDTAKKRRYHYGTNHHNGKLSDRAVTEIRARRAAGEKLSALAKDFDVSESLISQIYLRRLRDRG